MVREGKKLTVEGQSVRKKTMNPKLYARVGLGFIPSKKSQNENFWMVQWWVLGHSSLFLNFFKNLTMCMTKLKVLVLIFPNFTDIFIASMSLLHISLLHLSLAHVVAIYVATIFTHMMSSFFLSMLHWHLCFMSQCYVSILHMFLQFILWLFIS